MTNGDEALTTNDLSVPVSAFGSPEGILVVKLMIAANDLQIDLATPHGLVRAFPSFNNVHMRAAAALYGIVYCAPTLLSAWT